MADFVQERVGECEQEDSESLFLPSHALSMFTIPQASLLVEVDMSVWARLPPFPIVIR